MQLLHRPVSTSDPIPDRFYIIVMEFFVAEPQKFLLVKCLHAAGSSEEKRLFSQAIKRKTPAKCLGNALWGGGGGDRWFGIDWYILTPPPLK